MGMDNFPSAVVQVRGGKLRAIAVTSEKRSPLLPDVPALNEVVPGVQAVAWQGMFAPAGTPDEVVARLEREIIAILRQPDYVAALAESGSTPTPKPRAEFANFVKAETTRWSEIVKASGAKAGE
jgi:tripartite-type tricarboxylate transporter receptor subunit TctC